MRLSTVMSTIDVRSIAPLDRKKLIFSTFASLKGGESMQLLNDHRPEPLLAQFETRFPGEFAWTYLQDGSDVWRFEIGRIASAKSGAACCGCCSGTEA